MLLAEAQYKANGTRIRTLKFCYDEKGSPIGFVHIDASGTDSFYYYAKNLQGDVVALYRWNWSDEGKHTVTLEATYSYDPWGKLLSVKSAGGSPISATLTTNIANVNPFRYRGYYYDNETGFYYLQSRYYDPAISRFINADEYASTGQGFIGTNMFTYCNNNPVMFSDPSGNLFYLDDLFLACVCVVAVVVIPVAVVLIPPAQEIVHGITQIAEPYVDVLVETTIKITEQIYTKTYSQATITEAKKQSRKSGKETASDKPSWVNRGMVDSGQSAQQNATRILNEKYGVGNWRKGPGEEFNQIVKWITRSGLLCAGEYYISQGVEK